MKKRRKMLKQAMVIFLASGMVLVLLESAVGFGKGKGGWKTPREVLAAEEPGKAGTTKEAEISGKDEVVYVSLDPEGAVKGMYVVNILEAARGGNFCDYGSYSEVRNLTDLSYLEYKDGVVSGEAGEGRFYYQGNLEDRSLPWTVSVSGSLDGKQLPMEEMAGKSGKLELVLKIEAGNTGREFYENYVLQISMAMDTELCRNIEAEGASVADAGEKKQITFTALPGKDSAYKVSADVTEFEMEGISIAAIPFRMAFDLPDMENMTDQMGALSDGISELNDGVGELKEGASSLAEGVKALKDGSSSYQSGLKEFSDGTLSLKRGGDQFKTGLSHLTEGAFNLETGMEKYWDGLDAFLGGIKSLKDGSEQYKTGMEAVAGQADSLIRGSQAIRDGLLSVSEQLKKQLGSGEDKAGVGEGNGGMLLEQLAALPEGLREFAGGVGGIGDGLAGIVENYGTIFSGLEGVISQIPDISEEAIGELGQDNETVNQLIGAYRAARTVKETYSRMKAGVDGIQTSLGEMAAALQEIRTSLNGTADQLDAAIKESNLTELTGALEELSGGLDLLAGQYGSFHEGLAGYTDGIKSLSESYSNLDSGIRSVNDNAKALREGYRELEKGSGQLAEGLERTEEGFKSLLDGIGSLSVGAGELAGGYEKLDGGIGRLASGSSGLSEGVGALQEGTERLHLETKDMPEKMQEEIDRLLKEYDKSDFEPVSFVSEKNKNVSLVQFVIQTEGIKKAETSTEEKEPEEEKTIWDRFLDLFR